MGYSEPPLFISVPRLLHENSYLWHVHVIIYKRPTADYICCIHHVVEATTPRWTSEGGMREAAREALALLQHEVEEQMEQSQYRHFPSNAREGAEAIMMPAGDRDREAVKEVNLLGEHEEESS
jgi:hypothetical protein